MGKDVAEWGRLHHLNSEHGVFIRVLIINYGKQTRDCYMKMSF